ncbi:CHAT domain-containing protein [Okeania sp. SIO1I7]|uniref:CHAT domain-containing protein n=1 Tax=Okeania sp. SIO1I7 TaxID=2607772 RepID=UPI0013F84F6F|nr:CHAT domain-containing protein [Okeania sp. SIO1I7]NET25376.1 CHAT domain-containing protein [Okeania sp. SIO1I7]
MAFVILPPTPTANSELFVWQSTEEDLENLREWVIEYLGKYDEIKEAYHQGEENPDKHKNLQQEWEANITTRLEKLGEILHINEIIQPILERKCERLTLIPDFFLHLLPLHALVINPENSQENPDKIYLQDYFPQGIRFAPSCQILQKVRKRQCQDFQSLFAIQTPTPDLYEQDLSVVSAIKQQVSIQLLAVSYQQQECFF